MKHIHAVRTIRANGTPRWHVYAWRGGPLICARDARTRPTFMPREIRVIEVDLKKRRVVDRSTLRSLICEWRSQDREIPSSAAWLALPPGAKRAWGKALSEIDERWGETPLETWNEPAMGREAVAWRESYSSRPRSADVRIEALYALLDFGRTQGRLSANVAEGILPLASELRRVSEPCRPWRAADIERFAAAALAKARRTILDGVLLALLTGLSRAELVSLRWTDVKDDTVSISRGKRGLCVRRTRRIPIDSPLRALLQSLRARSSDGVEAVLVDSNGNQWTAEGFSRSFKSVRDFADVGYRDVDAGRALPKSFAALRVTFCLRLLSTGSATIREAATVTGWSFSKVQRFVDVYCNRHDLLVDDALLMRIIRSGQHEAA